MPKPRAQLHHTPDTRRDPAAETPCRGRHELFDSRDPADHDEAKALCRICPALTACKANLRAVLAADKSEGGSPEGTWAGVLYGGVLTKRGAGQLGNSKARGAA